MKIIREIVMVAVAVCSFIWTNEAASQTIQLTGIVRDKEGVPIEGASVKIQDSSEYVVTDSEGRFYINTDKMSW